MLRLLFSIVLYTELIFCTYNFRDCLLALVFPTRIEKIEMEKDNEVLLADQILLEELSCLLKYAFMSHILTLMLFIQFLQFIYLSLGFEHP